MAEPPFQIVDPRIRLAWNCWRALLRPGRVPARSALDPLAMPAALPILWLFRREEDGTFILTLAGEAIREVWGANRLMRRPVAELFPPDMWPALKARCDRILDLPAVQHAHRQLAPQRVGAHRSAERLMLPLADDNGRPTHILGASAYRLDLPHGPSDRLDPLAEPTQIPVSSLWDAPGQ
ncbi:MAG: hypothetical protein OHK0024_25680 [Thalassobaculales bacterium]